MLNEWRTDNGFGDYSPDPGNVNYRPIDVIMSDDNLYSKLYVTPMSRTWCYIDENNQPHQLPNGIVLKKWRFSA